jgi:hypothetical protein
MELFFQTALNGNLSVWVQVTGSPAYTVIAFCYILALNYSLTLAPIAWVYAAEVWSLESRATGSCFSRKLVRSGCRILFQISFLTTLQAVQFRDWPLYPAGLPEHLVETFHPIWRSLRRSLYPSFFRIPGDSWQNS